jgi:hypothetical protein
MIKRNFLIITIFFYCAVLHAQENHFSINSGYATANIEDTDLRGTGWKINAIYEFNPNSEKFLHGVSFGFVNTHASEGDQSYRINSFPLYYAPKWLFGKGMFKGFLNTALGLQFSGIRREGIVDLSDSDMGFYGGAGAGVEVDLNEDIFINIEYQIAWASNKYYKDGWISTIGGGIGFKFY